MYKYRLWIVIMILTLIVVYLAVFISANDTMTLRHEREHNLKMIDDLQQIIEDKDFAYTACDKRVVNLEQVIEGKDGLILELKVKEEMYLLTKDLYLDSIYYIRWVQALMDKAGVAYPEYIVDSLLKDDYGE